MTSRASLPGEWPEALAAAASPRSSTERRPQCNLSTSAVAACLAACSLVIGAPAGAQPPSVVVASTAPWVVWQYSTAQPSCGGADYPDVPARPFLAGSGAQQKVLWFASNSSGSWSSVGVGTTPDILATLARGPGCTPWLPPARYIGTTPESYDTGLWAVAPYTRDGVNIYALVHNEFHGEWTRIEGQTYCWQQTSTIFLPCDYWNLVGALSSNAGASFALAQSAPGVNVPAIALTQPYVAPSPTSQSTIPQGMTAQSNIIQIGAYLYVLAQQLGPPGSAIPDGVCVFRAAVPVRPDQAPFWFGFDGIGFSIVSPQIYPGKATQPCKPVFGSQFRFSWSFNTILNQFILLGLDSVGNVNTGDCPLAEGTGTPDTAIVYMTVTMDGGGLLVPATQETCLLQVNGIAAWQQQQGMTGAAYPSLLDPQSPELVSIDLNFQFSGATPFLYYTRLNPKGPGNLEGEDRDLVRVPLSVTAGP